MDLQSLKTYCAEIIRALPFAAGYGRGAVVMGDGRNAAIGNYSVAAGYCTAAFGRGAFAEGCSDAELDSGLLSLVNERNTASEIYEAWLEESFALARGDYSHVEGYNCLAMGDGSHVGGSSTVALNADEFAHGRYNRSVTANGANTIFSIGIGSSSTRKNAFEVRENGDAYFYGLGGFTGGNSGSCGTLKQVIDAKYVKPSAGIPESDLSTALQGLIRTHVIEAREYDYACAASSQAAGYIFFGNVVPTSEDAGNAWYIRYRLYVDLESEDQTISQNNKYCHGVYECRIGESGNALIYAVFNQMFSTSYRPIYHHLITRYANSTEGGATVTWQTKYADRATNPLKVGVRVQSTYADTQPRHYRIELLETYNCTFAFLDTIETYSSVYTTAKYGACDAITADNGLQESGDANDTTTMQLTYSLITAGTSGIKMYSLVMQDASGKWQSLTTDSGTGVGKTVNQAGFRLGSKVYYVYRSTDVAANDRIGTSQLRMNNANIDFRYSLNINTTAGHVGNLEPYKPLYIVGSVDANDGLFYLDTTQWWTQDEPSTENGKLYIKVCEAIYADYVNDRCYRGDFFGDGQMFWYKNGAFRAYEATAIQSVKTINGQSIVGSGNITISGGGGGVGPSEIIYGGSLKLISRTDIASRPLYIFNNNGNLASGLIIQDSVPFQDGDTFYVLCKYGYNVDNAANIDFPIASPYVIPGSDYTTGTSYDISLNDLPCNLVMFTYVSALGAWIVQN